VAKSTVPGCSALREQPANCPFDLGSKEQMEDPVFEWMSFPAKEREKECKFGK